MREDKYIQKTKNPAVWLLTQPIRLYRRLVSPKKAACCRFSPTCSAYALDALYEWGALRGSALALWRLLRCNPFGKGGFDPVPVNVRRLKRQWRREEKRADKLTCRSAAERTGIPDADVPPNP